MQDFRFLYQYLPLLFSFLAFLAVLKFILFFVRHKQLADEFDMYFIQKGFRKRREEEGEHRQERFFLEKNGLGVCTETASGKNSETRYLLYRKVDEKIPHFYVERRWTVLLVWVEKALLLLRGLLVSEKLVVLKNPEYEKKFLASISEEVKSVEWLGNFISKNPGIFELAKVNSFVSKGGYFELEVPTGFFKQENGAEIERILDLLEELQIPN